MSSFGVPGLMYLRVCLDSPPATKQTNDSKQEVQNRQRDDMVGAIHELPLLPKVEEMRTQIGSQLLNVVTG